MRATTACARSISTSGRTYDRVPPRHRPSGPQGGGLGPMCCTTFPKAEEGLARRRAARHRATARRAGPQGRPGILNAIRPAAGPRRRNAGSGKPDTTAPADTPAPPAKDPPADTPQRAAQAGDRFPLKASPFAALTRAASPLPSERRGHHDPDPSLTCTARLCALLARPRHRVFSATAPCDTAPPTAAADTAVPGMTAGVSSPSRNTWATTFFDTRPEVQLSRASRRGDHWVPLRRALSCRPTEDGVSPSGEPPHHLARPRTAAGDPRSLPRPARFG